MSGFKKAAPQQAFLKLGMYGAPGAGKTFTSLLLAEGLAEVTGKRVAFVDTERGSDFYSQAVPQRTVHPEAFDFDALYTRSLTDILQEARKLDTSRYGVLVIDSVTHLWEAAIAAYTGRQTRAGTIPFQAWAQIKKPYKELVNLLINLPMHVIICGRQGTEYGEDEGSGELKAVGKKMKAEGETAYEPHVLIRMEGVKTKKGTTDIHAYIEKDRTGVLAGKTIVNPTFASLGKPLLPLLGGTQARLPDEDETASVRCRNDSARMDREKERFSHALLVKLSAELSLASSVRDLEERSSRLVTTDAKRKMLPAHVAELREHFAECRQKLGGTQAEVPPAPQAAPSAPPPKPRTRKGGSNLKARATPEQVEEIGEHVHALGLSYEDYESVLAADSANSFEELSHANAADFLSGLRAKRGDGELRPAAAEVA